MATGWPMKTTYANGDVYSASDVNDITGTINLLGASVAYTAGKNKIINGDFYVNQRNATTCTGTGTDTWIFDRWLCQASGGATFTPQNFTAGTAPVTGYEGKTYQRIVTTGQTGTSVYTQLLQRIEDVRTFANQAVTISFWAKASTGTPKIAVEARQDFGTGGSPSTAVNTYIGQSTLSTSWVRYTQTVTIPSISGKTLGTTNNSFLAVNLWTSAGTDFNSRTGSLGIQSATIDIWGVQVESGSTVTAFQTATGTIQNELAACQRYYYRQTASTAYMPFTSNSSAYTTSSIVVQLPLPVQMRVAPTSLEYASLMFTDQVSNVAAGVALSLDSQNSKYIGGIFTSGGGGVFTIYRTYQLIANNSTSAYLAFNAEL